MKKQTVLRTFSLLIISSLIIGLCACGSGPAGDDSDLGTVTVTISIVYPEDAKRKSPDDFAMNVSEKATIRQVLEAFCEQEGIPIELNGNSVSGINKVMAAGNSVWGYMINDEEKLSVDAAQKIKDGDNIVWQIGKL
jgi:hypothetical protein